MSRKRSCDCGRTRGEAAISVAGVQLRVSAMTTASWTSAAGACIENQFSRKGGKAKRKPEDQTKANEVGTDRLPESLNYFI